VGGAIFAIYANGLDCILTEPSAREGFGSVQLALRCGGNITNALYVQADTKHIYSFLQDLGFVTILLYHRIPNLSRGNIISLFASAILVAVNANIIDYIIHIEPVRFGDLLADNLGILNVTGVTFLELS
jgi:hypothetical protein